MIDSVAVEYLCKGQNFLLLPQKAIFWREKRTLIVADIHFGKVGHFRKSGIAIPKGLEQEDLATMSDLIREYNPKRILFLGDLFHSEMNKDWDWLVMWRELFRDVEMVLVKGNHDIVEDRLFEQLNFRLADFHQEGPFLFTHKPLKPAAAELTDHYIISGHIHPGVTLRGAGKQSASLPCFYFGAKQAILPAFGRFTGRFSITFEPCDHVFGVLNHKVISL